jgi:hypothetical protein
MRCASTRAWCSTSKMSFHARPSTCARPGSTRVSMARLAWELPSTRTSMESAALNAVSIRATRRDWPVFSG